MRAHARELVKQAEGADGGVVLDLNVSGELRAIGENDAVADDAIVADVGIGHDQIVAADARGAAAFDGAAMHGAEFTKIVGVAHFQAGALARERQILRIAADDGERMHVIVLAELRRTVHHGVRLKHAAVAELDIVAHHGARADADAGAEFRGGRNDRSGIDGPGIDFVHCALPAGTEAGGISVSRSTILHMSVASAASSPFTVALPCSLQNPSVSRQATTSISRRSWSPGTTGRRKRAPSMETK